PAPQPTAVPPPLTNRQRDRSWGFSRNRGRARQPLAARVDGCGVRPSRTPMLLRLTLGFQAILSGRWSRTPWLLRLPPRLPPDRPEVRREVALDLAERVAAGLLQERPGQDQRQHRLADDTGGRHH